MHTTYGPGDQVTHSSTTYEWVGPDGVAGVEPPNGEWITPGATGPQGPKGDTGSTGATGATGPAGPGSLTVVTPAQTADFTAADGHLYTVDATAGAINVTIPHAAGAKVMVIRIDNAPAHAVTLTPDSGSIESGGGTYGSKTLNAQGGVAYMIGDGTNVQDVLPNTYGGDGSFRNLTVGAANVGGTGLLTAGDDFRHSGDALAFYGASVQTKQAVTGSKGANAALASLVTALATIGLVTDSTT